MFSELMDQVGKVEKHARTILHALKKSCSSSFPMPGERFPVDLGGERTMRLTRCNDEEVRLKIIRHARIKNVGKSESCMVC